MNVTFDDLYDDIDSASPHSTRTDSPTSSLLNTPPPYDPEYIVRSESTQPLYQPSGLKTPPQCIAMLSSVHDNEDDESTWCVKTKDELWIELEEAKDQLSQQLAHKMPMEHGEFREEPKTQPWYEANYGTLDQQGALSLEVNGAIEAFPRISKIVVVVKPYIDNTGTFEMVYPLMLPYPITFETFFTQFREGRPPVDRFILACFRRKLRNTAATARLFFTTFGLLDYQSYVTQLHLETTSKEKISLALAQECPYKLGFAKRTGSITLTVHATIQAHFNNVTPQNVEPAIQHLYSLDYKFFERDRDFLINSLKEFQPRVRPLQTKLAIPKPERKVEPQKVPIRIKKFKQTKAKVKPGYTDRY